jgi:hypothetical protein
MTGPGVIGSRSIPIRDRHARAPLRGTWQVARLGEADPSPCGATGVGREAWHVGFGQRDAGTWTCRLETLAEAAALLTPRRGAILDLLLKAMSPVRGGDGSVLQPIWVNEAFERAIFIVELLLLLDHRTQDGRRRLPGLRIEHQTGIRLAMAFRCVNDLGDRTPQPCSDLLRYIVRDLVELFGPSVGDVAVKLEIERLALPRLQWRALILAAGNLVLRSLFRAFRGRSFGTITVSLRRVGRSSARLVVADDGCDRIGEREADGWAVLDDLAAILDSSFAYIRTDEGGMAAEIIVRPAILHVASPASEFV